MAVSHRGAISFGLVHIPVGLYIATSASSISFNQLHEKCKQRIKYKKMCPHCNEDVGSEDIVKGYEFSKDKYVVMTDDDLDKIKTEKDRAIHIIHFSDISQIDTIYFEKAYYAVPEQGGDKAFELLRYAMQHSGKVAIAKTVLGTKETLLTLIPTNDGILAETMFYNDEIRSVPKPYIKQSVSDAELNMAAMLIDSMTKTFDPSEFYDEYQNKLQNAISQKISGQEISVQKSEYEGNVANLMDALMASLDQIKSDEKEKELVTH